MEELQAIIIAFQMQSFLEGFSFKHHEFVSKLKTLQDVTIDLEKNE